MRVLHYLPSLRPEAGGPIRAVLDLSSSLAARGHPTEIATTELSSDLADQLRRGNQDLRVGAAKVICLEGRMAGTWPLEAQSIARARLLIAKADILHVHGVWNYSNIQMSKLASAMGKPYVVSAHGMLDDWCMTQRRFKKRVFLTLVGRKHLERAKAVHLTAEAEQTQSTPWFPRGKGVVIPNLLELQPFRNLPGAALAQAHFDVFRSNEPVVLFLSRVHVKKGAEVLLEAARLLAARGLKAQFVFAGAGDDGYVAQLKTTARELGLSDRVHFVGHVGGELKISLYQASLCLALPTFQENFGLVFPEAMAAETPIITTKGVDIWPQLQRGGGIIVERDARSFADAIAALMSDRSHRDVLAKQGRHFVFEEYDEGKILTQFETMYGCIE